MLMPHLTGSPDLSGLDAQGQLSNAVPNDYHFTSGFEFASPVQQLPEASSSSAVVHSTYSEGSNKRRRGLSTSGPDDQGISPSDYGDKPGTGARASKACGECRRASQRNLIDFHEQNF
jgi:hypothetical protein